MTSPARRLGPYELISALGAGGMGEVWLARDSRLSREVAVKVLPVEVAGDPSRLKRFEKESRAASALNHPNIVTIYDIGQTESVHWIAMERIEGKTLREILFGGPLLPKKTLGLAAQIADGLAKAHEAGIVHRDLKPENVMVTKDGLVKILDFGLAKQTSPISASDGSEASHLPTETGTSPGVVLGTVGYMSPEQAAGQPIGFRSDQFAFGSILYEMATGRRAFQKGTAVDTLSAILHEEPKPVAEINAEAPAPLRWIIDRCLAKEPERRYAATKDLARDLETLRDRSSETTSLIREPTGGPRRVAALPLALGALAVAVSGVFAGKALWKSVPSSPPKFQRLTFRRGFILNSARFSPDGRTIVYSASWDGQLNHVFEAQTESPISRRLDIPDGSLVSLSSGGELAILMNRPYIFDWMFPGTLATVPIAGGVPRELAAEVHGADSAPDGKRMAVVRQDALEFPMGRVIRRSREGIGFPRVSPTGDRIAFTEENRIHVVDASGKELFSPRKLDTSFASLAWSPAGEEIWFTEPLVAPGAVYALGASGKERVPLRLPSSVAIADISHDGRVLLSVGNQRWESWSRPSGQPTERELTILANSDAMGISPDGSTLLINESGSFYLRNADGSLPKKLGEGYGSALSADGKWAVVARPGPPAHLVLVPTGAGEEKVLENGGIERHERDGIYWSLDGRRLIFHGNEMGHGDRLYVQEITGGKPRPVTPEGVTTLSCSISPDGRFVIAEQPPGFWMYPVDGGEKRLVAGMLPTDFIWRNWSSDGRFVYAWNPAELPFHVFRVELSTGRREPWKTIVPQDPAGIWGADLIITPDGQSYAYNCKRRLSDLYLVEGLN